MKNKKILSTVLGALLMVGSMGHAATILTFQAPDGNTNKAINLNYGSNATQSQAWQDASNPGYEVDGDGTPNIALLFGPATGGGSTISPAGWQLHSSSGTGGAWGSGSGANGVAQIEMDTNLACTLDFIPEANYGVVLESFDFITDTNNRSYEFLVEVFDITAGRASLYSQTHTFTLNAGGIQLVDLNITGEVGHQLQLSLTRRSGERNDIGVDNIRFSQIPEPSVAALGVLGLFGLAARRRK